MAKLVLCHVAKLSKIKQMWHLQMICSKFAIEVNPFFRPVLLTSNKVPFDLPTSEVQVEIMPMLQLVSFESSHGNNLSEQGTQAEAHYKRYLNRQLCVTADCGSRIG